MAFILHAGNFLARLALSSGLCKSKGFVPMRRAEANARRFIVVPCRGSKGFKQHDMSSAAIDFGCWKSG